MRSGAKSYMRKGFLIYEEMRKNLTINEEAVSHLRLCTRSHLNFFIYDGNFLFSFISVLLKLLCTQSKLVPLSYIQLHSYSDINPKWSALQHHQLTPTQNQIMIIGEHFSDEKPQPWSLTQPVRGMTWRSVLVCYVSVQYFWGSSSLWWIVLWVMCPRMYRPFPWQLAFIKLWRDNGKVAQ
jgi:hypothetical protein